MGEIFGILHEFRGFPFLEHFKKNQKNPTNFKICGVKVCLLISYACFEISDGETLSFFLKGKIS